MTRRELRGGNQVLKEFKAFISRGNVVDLAVAVVIGAAFGAVVTSFVENIITPIIGIPGKNDFSTLHFTINDSVFRYGLFLNALISFLSIAAAVFFFVVKPLNMLAERRKKGQVAPEESPAPSDEALLLAEIRDLLKSERIN
jgi:large conductance mechanosensitive channel